MLGKSERRDRSTCLLGRKETRARPRCCLSDTQSDEEPNCMCCLRWGHLDLLPSCVSMECTDTWCCQARLISSLFVYLKMMTFHKFRSCEENLWILVKNWSKTQERGLLVFPARESEPRCQTLLCAREPQNHSPTTHTTRCDDERACSAERWRGLVPRCHPEICIGRCLPEHHHHHRHHPLARFSVCCTGCFVTPSPSLPTTFERMLCPHQQPKSSKSWSRNKI